MAAKIKLDLDAPEGFTFPQAVKIPNETGKKLEVTFDFIYRDREAFAKLQDEWMAKAEEAFELSKQIQAEKVNGETVTIPSMSEITARALARDVEAVQLIATGWNLDIEFTTENLTKFCKRYPSAGLAVINEYKTSLTDGRLPN
jgi:hypothetical protein